MTTPDPAAHAASEIDAARQAQRLHWARAASGEPALLLQRASTDAGQRSYWRGSSGPRSWIVMDSPPGVEDVAPWLQMHGVFAGAGVRVPAVHACDGDAGLLLLEDLGTATLAQVLDDDNADALFDDALTQLLRIQAIAPPPGMRSFDDALLRRDAGLFDDWFLRRHLGVVLDGDDLAALHALQATLADNALAQPRVLVHRDYMARNLMPVDDGPAVLDFQDAVIGPVAYDPISLFKDAFASWPLPRVDAWLAHYHRRARAAGIPVPGLQDFLRDADWLGVQRHLKILGIFARLHHRDGKSHYLRDAPRFIDYIAQVLPRHPELAALRGLLDRHVRPAMAALR